MKTSNRKKIREVAGWYKTEGFYQKLLDLEFNAIQKFFVGRSVLEIGPADGYHTRKLADHFASVTCMEPSNKYCRQLKEELGKKIRVVKQCVEAASLKETFDTILCAHLLEHLRDPVTALKKIRGMTHPKTNLIVIVPNANSLHRHVGVALKMLAYTKELNDLDKKLGHYRVYDRMDVTKDLKAAGLKINHFGGILIKPLSNAQMESWDEKLVQALYQVGNQFPEICADIVFVCTKAA